jgi:hypothetical protein
MIAPGMSVLVNFLQELRPELQGGTLAPGKRDTQPCVFPFLGGSWQR